MSAVEYTTPAPAPTAGPTSLRRFTAADAADFAAIHHDPLNVKWAGADASMTAERAAALIAGPVATGWDDGTLLRFAIVEGPGDGRIIGTLSLRDVRHTRDGGSAAVGIKLLAAGRGRGSATRAVGLACDYALGVLGLSVLHWHTTVGNHASRALAERCGFRLAAEIPGHGHVDGHLAGGWVLVREAAAPELELRPEVPRLTDGTVLLRALQDSDAEQLVANCSNPGAIRWTTVPLGYTREHAVHFINTITPEGWRSGATLTFAVADPDTDGLLGTVDLQCKNPGTAAVGINFGEQARGTGAAEKAVRLLAGYAFDQLNLSFLYWSAMVPNWGSRKLAWKLGFTLEGQVRGMFNDRGTPADRWILTLADTDPRTPQASWDGPAAPTR
ncbi:GNAT family N-acetyltransferase [Arthrobacter sp. STN4]|uniref:GNAT family N-acetyltransferase n=1 Tax=Arthrobacter sp. STN4 TaxID=2923276 RepID=UPI002119BB9A|nr:GNAT family protein [Arthrobacter sp. STN4]MCQ9165627.1 GNAT family N-acetyltransferase [Arthrobacter sp. STN4]